jgi:hypothetical protein
MTLSGLVLGLINVAIVVAILVLVGAVIVMFAKWMQWPIDWNVQRLYLLVVALIALYMIVALLFGLPAVRVIGQHRSPPIGAELAPTPSIMIPETLGRRIN